MPFYEKRYRSPRLLWQALNESAWRFDTEKVT